MRQGQRAEELVEWGCRRLDDQLLAFVRKTEPKVLIRRAAGRIVGAAHVGSAPPDFLGFTAAGRGVCFDVKQAEADGTWRWRERSPLTKMRQIADLERAGREFHAVAGLLVVVFGSPVSKRNAQDRAVWVPWWHVGALGDERWTVERFTVANVAWGDGRSPWVSRGGLVNWPAGGDPDWMAAAASIERAQEVWVRSVGGRVFA